MKKMMMSLCLLLNTKIFSADKLSQITPYTSANDELYRSWSETEGANVLRDASEKLKKLDEKKEAIFDKVAYSITTFVTKRDESDFDKPEMMFLRMNDVRKRLGRAPLSAEKFLKQMEAKANAIAQDKEWDLVGVDKGDLAKARFEAFKNALQPYMQK